MTPGTPLEELTAARRALAGPHAVVPADLAPDLALILANAVEIATGPTFAAHPEWFDKANPGTLGLARKISAREAGFWCCSLNTAKADPITVAQDAQVML